MFAFMASETLKEKKPDGGATAFEEKETSAEEDKEKGASEMEEKGVSDEENDSKEVEIAEEGKGSKEEGEKSKKVKTSRESKKVGGESKKSGEESIQKQPRRKSLSPGEPVTPTERPARERKSVERYSALSSEKVSSTKGFSIEKGHGSQLKDIPNVAFKLSKRKPDENLQMLHTILFGKKTKVHSLKRNINQFSGFVWVENEEKHRARIKEKLDKCVKEKLLDFCDVLDIPVSKATVKKEELSAKLLEFLESPHATTEVSLADKEQKVKKRKRKAAVGRKVTASEVSADGSNKRRKQTPKVIKKRKRSAKIEEEVDEDEVESASTRGDSDKGDDSDGVQREESDQGESESEQEEEKTKAQTENKKGSAKKNVKGSGSKTNDKSISAKKGTPKSVKSPAKSVKSSSKSALEKGADDDDRVFGSPSKPKASPIKTQIGDERKKSPKNKSASTKDKTSKKQPGKYGAKVSTKEQGKGKASTKVKAEPSREEMHAAVGDIVKEVDFNTATLSDIIRQLGTHFGMDLMHKKVEVKRIIEDVINNMTDEEDEEDNEEEENADEAEDDTKDKADEDNDA